MDTADVVLVVAIGACLLVGAGLLVWRLPARARKIVVVAVGVVVVVAVLVALVLDSAKETSDF